MKCLSASKQMLALVVASGLSISSQAYADTMSLVGSAIQTGSAIQLTDTWGQVGAAWYNTPLSTSQSFNATFSFQLNNPWGNQNGNSMADGVAFALQNVGNSVAGWGGGDIGYSGLGAVGSVVQSWGNNTAGLNIDGNAYHTQHFAGGTMALAATVTGTETVSYDASTHMLTMNGNLNLDGMNHAISDSASIDLAAKFGPTMYAGFTGGTGGSYAFQYITSASIAPVPEPETYALMLAGLGLLGVVSRRRKLNAA